MQTGLNGLWEDMWVQNKFLKKIKGQLLTWVPMVNGRETGVCVSSVCQWD